MPGVILQFLDRASVALACTRDEKLVPRIHWVSGWQVVADQRSIWCFIPKEFGDGLSAAFETNGHFALTIEHIGPHECYQFKGRFLSLRPATERKVAQGLVAQLPAVVVERQPVARRLPGS